MKFDDENGKVPDEDDLPRVTSAEVTDDGAVILKFDRYIIKGKKKGIFMPEALFALLQDYGVVETEGKFAGIPHVYEEDIYDEDEEDDDDDGDGDPGDDEPEPAGGDKGHRNRPGGGT